MPDTTQVKVQVFFVRERIVKDENGASHEVRYADALYWPLDQFVGPDGTRLVDDQAIDTMAESRMDNHVARLEEARKNPVVQPEPTWEQKVESIRQSFADDDLKAYLASKGIAVDPAKDAPAKEEVVEEIKP